MRSSERAIRLLKMSVAAGLAWYLASLLSPHRNPYFAPLAVVITFQSTVAETMAKAWYRCAGIVGGVAVALVISQWLHVGAVTIALAVLVGAAISTLLGLDPQITTQVGVTVVMVLASSGTPHYAEYRIFETLLGAVVGVVVNALILPPNRLPVAEKRVLAVVELLSASLLSLSSAPHVEPLAQQIDQEIRGASQALREAGSAFKLNPFAQSGRIRVGELATALGQLEQAGMHVNEIARGLGALGPRIDGYRTDLNDALQETAACVAAFGRAAQQPSDELLSQVSDAVAQAKHSQEQCLAYLKETASLADLRDLSAVLADLDRILGEVSGDPRDHHSPVAVHQPVALGHH